MLISNILTAKAKLKLYNKFARNHWPHLPQHWETNSKPTTAHKTKHNKVEKSQMISTNNSHKHINFHSLIDYVTNYRFGRVSGDKSRSECLCFLRKTRQFKSLHCKPVVRKKLELQCRLFDTWKVKCLTKVGIERTVPFTAFASELFLLCSRATGKDAFVLFK